MGIRWLRKANHQLIGGKHPIIYRVSNIQGDAGFVHICSIHSIMARCEEITSCDPQWNQSYGNI